MICTVTFNPALDYVMRLSELTPGRTNRAQWEELQVGGKGLNVSLVLRTLGVETTALGFLAGDTGDLLRRRLEATGVRTDFVDLPGGMTRINVKVKSGQETELNGRGPDIPSEAMEALLAKLEALGAGDTLVLSGSIPPSLPQDTYRRVLSRLAGRAVRCVVDAEGGLLADTLPYRPFLIKPNHHELAQLTGCDLDPGDLDALAHAAGALQAQGARNVLVSLAEHGALLVTEEGRLHTQAAPTGTVRNSVGAGDSMVAGFLAGYDRGGFAEGLRLGTAAGSATAFSPRLATADEIQAVYRQLQKG